MAGEDEAWVELAYTVMATNGINRFADALRVPPDFSDNWPFKPYLPLVSEEEAEGRVKRTYEDIKEFYQMDKVPNAYKALALNPTVLDIRWRFVKSVFQDQEGKLDRFHKELFALAASAGARSPYGMDFHMREARRLGADDEVIYEVMAVVHYFSGLTRFAETLQLEPDMLPRQL